MVAHHPDIVIERVEAQHHRADGLMLEGFDEVALNGVAGVHQDQVGLLGPYLFDLSGYLAQAARQIFRVAGVVPGHEGAVQIGGAQQGDIYRFGGHDVSRESQDRGKDDFFHKLLSLNAILT